MITAQPDVMAELEQVVAKLDIRRAQVLVEAIIVEIADGDGLNLGVQWANTNGGGTQFTDTGLPIGSVAIAARITRRTAPPPAWPRWPRFQRYGGRLLQGQLGRAGNGAFHRYQERYSLHPEYRHHGQQGSLIQRRPGSAGAEWLPELHHQRSGVQHHRAQDGGHQAGGDAADQRGDSVLLNIEQEVSSVAQTQAPGTSTLGPTFDTRTIKNAVLVKSGETVVLGGLMDEKTQEKVSKVPLLGDIPVLGYLFRSTSTRPPSAI